MSLQFKKCLLCCSGIRHECYISSCSRKDTRSPAAFRSISFRNWRTLLEKNVRDVRLSTSFTTTQGRMKPMRHVKDWKRWAAGGCVFPAHPSPDIALYDNHSTFRSLKALLAKKKITKIENVERGKGFDDLSMRWRPVVISDGGDYIVERIR